MLQKCANSACSSTFRKLSQGKLFLVESYPSAQFPARNPDSSRRIDHYWLCSHCAGLFTLSYQKGRGIVAVPITNAPKLPATPTVEMRGASEGRRA